MTKIIPSYRSLVKCPLGTLQKKYAPNITTMTAPQVVTVQHSLADYDKLLPKVGQGGCYA
jgi:hypothetical protein